MAVLASLPSSQPRSPDLDFMTPNSVSEIIFPPNEGHHDKPVTPTPTRQDAPRSSTYQSGDEALDSSLSKAPSDPSPREEVPYEKPPTEDTQDCIRSFRLYGQIKSTREVNEAIKAELLKPHPRTEGFIYGFLHPSNTRVRIGAGPDSNIQVIKIGRSVDVDRRMKEWKMKCEYKPLVVFSANAPHHHRIERIVHHQLHNSRLKEYPGCSGCSLQHNEWFRVSTIYAGHLVCLWLDFAQRQPYGEDGDLLPAWLDRLEHIDLEDPGCWMWFILGGPITSTTSTVDNAEEDNNESSSCR